MNYELKNVYILRKKMNYYFKLIRLLPRKNRKIQINDNTYVKYNKTFFHYFQVNNYSICKKTNMELTNKEHQILQKYYTNILNQELETIYESYSMKEILKLYNKYKN